jgi:2-hydroxychromene-2-carboxylate isomerase
MTNTSDLEFWFSIGSTYSYLSVQRVDEVAEKEGVKVRWRPFNIRTITSEMNNRPFVGKPVKAAYMWRDLERRCSLYGLEARLPAPYPLNDMELANRIAVVGQEEGWGPSYAKATYRRWMVNGEPAGSEPNVSTSLRAIGEEPDRVVALAKSDRIGDQLVEATNEARELGIFGAPSFIARGELFWGDDRLSDAIQWLRRGTLAST